MGRGKHCNEQRREEIVKLKNEHQWPIRKIADFLNISKNQVFNALNYFKKNETSKTVQIRNRSKKTTPRVDRKIIRLSKSDPLKTAVDIHKDISQDPTVHISIRTVRRRLAEAGLHGRIARRKPLINKKNRIKRVAFAKSHLSWSLSEWKHVLFSDE